VWLYLQNSNVFFQILYYLFSQEYVKFNMPRAFGGSSRSSNNKKLGTASIGKEMTGIFLKQL